MERDLPGIDAREAQGIPHDYIVRPTGRACIVPASGMYPPFNSQTQ